MSRPGIEPGPPRWEASALEKTSLLISIRKIYIWARRESSNFSLLFLGEQHCAPDVGAAAGPGPRPGEGDDGQDGHLVPLRQPDGAPHREQGRGDPHLLVL